MEGLKSIVARVLGIEPNELTDESSPDNIPSWDSFNGLIMVSELEKNYCVKFTMDEVTSITRFADIRACLMKHGVVDGLDETK